MVAGGSDGGNQFLNSCEVNIVGTKSWKYINPLPVAIRNHRAVTLDNMIFITGITQFASCPF